MTERARVMWVLGHAMFDDASDLEIAQAARSTVSAVRAERDQMARDRGVAALLERAASVSREDGPGGDPVAYLDSLLDRALEAAEKRRWRAAARVLARQTITGGARPPEQSRGAPGDRIPGGGLSPRSDATGRGAYR